MARRRIAQARLAVRVLSNTLPPTAGAVAKVASRAWAVNREAVKRAFAEEEAKRK